MAKEFAWDEEVLVGDVMSGDKVKFEIRKCKLNEKAYVSITKWVLTKQGWSYPKNSTFPIDTFNSIAHILANVNLYD